MTEIWIKDTNEAATQMATDLLLEKLKDEPLIDTCGLGEGLLTLRMAEFPEGRPREDLSAQSRVVPIAQLRDELPEEAKWVSPSE